MPNAYIINQRPINYGGALSLLVEMLVSAGWTYKGSGDGVSNFSSTGKIFTGTGTGALGWSNNNAWARIQDPATVREFVFQHDNNASVKIRYSANAKFVGGTPSATVAPTATDEKYLRGSSGAYSTWFLTGTLTAAYGTAITAGTNLNGSVTFMGAALAASPYGFWFASQLMDGAKTRGAGLLFDPVNSAPEDTDPYVIHIGGSPNGNTGAFAIGTSGSPGALGREGALAATWTTANGAAVDGSWGWMDTARTQYLYVQPNAWAANITGQTITSVGGQSGLLPNPFNGKQEGLPMAWVRASTAASIPGLKGWSTMMRWVGVGAMNGSTILPRYSFIDTLDNKNWICVGSVWLPWDGLTTPMG